jgi:hypothetical protein
MLPPRRHRLAFAFPTAVTFGVALLRSGGALACPDCPTAGVVRSFVLDERFWTNLMFITAPIGLLGVITALLFRIGIQQLPPSGQVTTTDQAST